MKTILLIDDDGMIRETVSDVLTLYGYKVITTDNGAEGINLVKQSNPDLILCDVMMPGMDGIGVIRALKKEVKLSTIPFIFLSAKSRKEDLQKGMEEGANDYIFKPFSNDILIERVEGLIS